MLTTTLLIPALLVFINGDVWAQEECVKICEKKFVGSSQEESACKEGCRLQIIFEFTNGNAADVERDDCYNGCSKSYDNVTDKDACKFGCYSQPHMKKNHRVHVTINNNEPSFDVAFAAIKKVFSNSLPSLGGLNSASSEEQHDSRSWNNPFADFHRRMQEEMERFNQIASNIMDTQRNNGRNSVIALHRPNGHMNKALEGPVVGNQDNRGAEIIEVAPVNSRKNEHFLGYQGENPTMVEIEDSSLLSRLAIRARRLSVLSRWLVCAALFLCLISMLSISVAIIKQIKSQRYHNLRNTHVVMPYSFVQPPMVKKVPLDEPPKINEYPQIHDTPPPAYDQLSIRKEEQSDQQDPKI